jgi:predicted phage terminase large subunit-like protein
VASDSDQNDKGILSELALQLRAQALKVAPDRVAGAELTEKEYEEAAEMAQNYSKFIRASWAVIEPGTQYIHGRHIDAIAEHLEACKRREIRRLIINIPPRFMKSISCAVGFCPWVWITEPYSKFLYSSYSGDLSTRDSVQSRFLIESPWYKRRWGHIYKLSTDQNVKTEFRNTATGIRQSTSVNASTTGKGGNFVICDDPHNALQAGSDAVRYTALNWWDRSMSTRLNDPKRDVLIVIMQRLHEKDLTGHLLEQGGYEHLCIPNEYVPTSRTTSIGWRDWRTKPGELLWPERFGERETNEKKITLQQYGYSGQFQQNPSPDGGGKFQSRWFGKFEGQFPWDQVRSIVRYWDLAATEAEAGKDPDWAVGALVALLQDGRKVILDIERLRGNPGDVEMAVRVTAANDGRSVPIRMEQEPGSSGKITTFNYKRVLVGYDFEGVPSSGKKEVRANPVSQDAQIGFENDRYNWLYVEGTWNKEFFRELEMFPFGEHDDQVDALSGAAAYILLSEDRALARLWNPTYHIVARSDFYGKLGHPTIPATWKLGRGFAYYVGAGQRPVLVNVAVPDEGSEYAGKVFVTQMTTFEHGSSPREVAKRIREREGLDHLRAARHSYINPEASSEIETFVREALYFHPWDLDETRGIAQLRNYLELRDELHPFNLSPSGDPLPTSPSIFFIVDDSQLTSAKDDEGLLALRQQIVAYYTSPIERTESGAALSALRAMAAAFFPSPNAMSKYTKTLRLLEEKFPNLADKNYYRQMDDESLDDSRKSVLMQMREMYFDAELRKAENHDKVGSRHVVVARKGGRRTPSWR